MVEREAPPIRAGTRVAGAGAIVNASVRHQGATASVVTRWFPVATLLVALAQGLLHLWLLPPWQHYDEPTHFEYAWLIANRGGLPSEGDQDSLMRREVAASMLEHDFFRDLTRPALLSENSIWLGYSELEHLPGYYLLVSLPLRAVRHLDITTQLYVARGVSLLLFLVTVLASAGVAKALFPAHAALRQALPLVVALLPPVASHMTAVNNDAGAISGFTLFLWGAVALIRRGPTVKRLLFVTVAAITATMMKNSAALSLLLLPLSLLLSFWLWRGLPWRWLGAAAMLLTVAGLAGVVTWGDAAYWYPQGGVHYQEAPTRAARGAVDGEAVVTVAVTQEDPYRRLANPLLFEHVESLTGNEVTIGGWLWADRPALVASPGIMVGESETREVTYEWEPREVTTVPTFFSYTYPVPENARVLSFLLWARPLDEQAQPPFHLYLDDAFVLPAAAAESWLASDPGSGLPASLQEQNLLRNPSGEQGWFRLRPWLLGTLATYTRRSPTYLFAAIQDLPRHVPFMTGVVIPWLLQEWFSSFAWGHVRFAGEGWTLIVRVLLGVVVLGALNGLRVHWRKVSAARAVSLFFLSVATIIVWLTVLVWPLSMHWGKIELPSPRYLYVVVAPMALSLTGGWYYVWPRALQRYAIPAGLCLLGLWNIASVMLLFDYYSG